MSGLFEGGLRKIVEVDDLEHEFYKHMADINEGTFSRPVMLGFYMGTPGPWGGNSGRRSS